jgi:hypothetical protein
VLVNNYFINFIKVTAYCPKYVCLPGCLGEFDWFVLVLQTLLQGCSLGRPYYKKKFMSALQ